MSVFCLTANNNISNPTILSQAGGAGTNFYIGSNEAGKIQITDDWDTGIDWSSIEEDWYRLTITKSETSTK